LVWRSRCRICHVFLLGVGFWTNSLSDDFVLFEQLNMLLSTHELLAKRNTICTEFNWLIRYTRTTPPNCFELTAEQKFAKNDQQNGDVSVKTSKDCNRGVEWYQTLHESYIVSRSRSIFKRSFYIADLQASLQAYFDLKSIASLHVLITEDS
jgi:hypothetical protein